MSCNLVRYKHFRGTCCLHLWGGMVSSTKLHSVTSQKTVIFIVTNVRISSLTLTLLLDTILTEALQTWHCFINYLILLQLQVLDHKSKGPPTCYCEDCIQRKKDKGSLMGSVEAESNKAQRSSDKQQEQYKRKTGANCSSGEPATNSNSLLSDVRISSATPQQQLSLSPCQSCQSTQDLVETSAPLLNTNSSLKNCLHCNGNWSSSEHSQDCGYSSENNNGCCDTGSASSSLPSSPEGSEIACSDGFCNHEGNCN